MKTWLAALIMGVALSATALSGMALAAIEAHEFASDAELARYRHLADILRCPKCQNQNIAESNSPIAADLRAEVRRMLAAGHSDQQIIQFMVERYGDFVLYQPPFDVRTILLWLGPAGLLMAGAVMLGSRVARARRARSAAAPLTETECQRLAQLLRSTDTRRK